MGFDWTHFYEISKYIEENDYLCTIGKPLNKDFLEASARTVVSRAYYSAFNYTLNFAKTKKYDHFIKIKFPNNEHHNDHMEIREFLKRSFSKHTYYNEIVNDLNNLRYYRNKCDYENDVKNIINIAEESVDISKDIIFKINFLSTL